MPYKVTTVCFLHSSQFIFYVKFSDWSVSTHKLRNIEVKPKRRARKSILDWDIYIYIELIAQTRLRSLILKRITVRSLESWPD